MASEDFAGPVNTTIRATRLPGVLKNDDTNSSQNVPSTARVAAAAFGFLTLIQVLNGPDRYGAFSFFETIPSRPSLFSRLALAVSMMLPSVQQGVGNLISVRGFYLGNLDATAFQFLLANVFG